MTRRQGVRKNSVEEQNAFTHQVLLSRPALLSSPPPLFPTLLGLPTRTRSLAVIQCYLLPLLLTHKRVYAGDGVCRSAPCSWSASVIARLCAVPEKYIFVFILGRCARSLLYCSFCISSSSPTIHHGHCLPRYLFLVFSSFLLFSLSFLPINVYARVSVLRRRPPPLLCFGRLLSSSFPPPFFALCVCA